MLGFDDVVGAVEGVELGSDDGADVTGGEVGLELGVADGADVTGGEVGLELGSADGADVTGGMVGLELGLADGAADAVGVSEGDEDGLELGEHVTRLQVVVDVSHLPRLFPGPLFGGHWVLLVQASPVLSLLASQTCTEGQSASA
mmetsp:Transcript_38213/g.70549  ORF Transcript_38213/g.70549 Transcript_38213/m.70549 type:complete len:145 (+) Transcript_38213:1248-1682(+)